MTTFKCFKWKTVSQLHEVTVTVSQVLKRIFFSEKTGSVLGLYLHQQQGLIVPALAARAPERKVGPKLTITLANLASETTIISHFLTHLLTHLLTYQIMKRPKVMHWGLSLTRRATSSSSSSGRMGASFKITDRRFT